MLFTILIPRGDNMEVKDLITIFEGNVYSVGTGSSAITIPSKIKSNYGIEDGDTLMVGIIKVRKAVVRADEIEIDTSRSEKGIPFKKAEEIRKGDKSLGENPSATASASRLNKRFGIS